MLGSVYLLGGGEIGRGETRLIDDYILSHVKRAGDIVFIGAASGDSQEYFETFKKVYNDGSKTIFLTSDQGKNEFLNYVKNAKIIYLGGGDTETLKNQLIEWDAKKVFIEALKNNTDIVGISAGAYVLSKYYTHEENGNIDINEGLGFAPFVIQVHSTPTKEKAALSVLKPIEQKTPFIAISDRSALVVDINKTTSIGDGYISRYDNK